MSDLSTTPASMALSMVTGPGQTSVVEVPVPTAGPADVLVKIRACGICGSDAMYIAIGGLPGREGRTPLGHEPAGEVVAVGSDVVGVSVGDHVVVNPMAAPSGIIGSGGATGGMADYLLVENAVVGTSLAIVPDHIPFEVAALNEPMAVARHAVNRTRPKPGDKVVIFGAGPIGLGAAISYMALGVEHIVVVDVIASRLEKALQIGVDAVVNSAEEDLVERLVALHGEGPARRGVRKPASDIYLDATGAAPVVKAILGAAKHGATLGIVGVHKKPVEVDFGELLGSELTIVLSMGYPTEIFEVTQDIIANWQKYAVIVSDVFPFADVQRAFEVAATPGAADKVVVTFD
ncbi:zinc-binding dehydrogenase [Agreia sp. PsM10]|uniref:zinc-dependent alcohol dehydrogenase n=1 Tax=Agreia sp. PsM10 TaxID=3030533 RepID=UPI00263B5210|nr:zinc-binding dehydrogenase [Agreia sp. PsM10]MDN4639932.1 zinc-binding dehydrogenase [Agreia sp. PsM10]